MSESVTALNLLRRRGTAILHELVLGVRPRFVVQGERGGGGHVEIRDKRGFWQTLLVVSETLTMVRLSVNRSSRRSRRLHAPAVFALSVRFALALVQVEAPASA